jgi:nitrite reductase/ring-hydroxylating ferredoxin subunit
MGDKRENRVERIVSDMLRGRRLKLRGGDAEEKEAIIMAAKLAAARQGPQRMSPGFRQQLARRLESAPPEGWLTRRAALVAGLGVAAGAVGGGVLGRSLQAAQAPAATASVVKPVGGSWFDVGALEDFTPGQAQQVKAGAVGAFVTREGDGVSAVSSICSDLPCELWWDKSQALLACPCHNQTFTTHGQSTNMVYPLPPLDTVLVRVTTAGRVEVLGI